MSAQLLTQALDDERSTVTDSYSSPDGKNNSRLLAGLFFSLLLALVFMLSVWRLLDPQTLPIKHVRIEGNFQHLSTEKMQSIVTAVIKGGFFNLNVMSIKEALLQEPWVNWVAVQRVWPDGLNVYVKEQTAVAHWNSNSLLNDSSQVFTPHTPHFINGIPFLSGPDGTQGLVYQRYIQINNALSEKVEIESVNLSERRAWHIQLTGGPLIILGRNDVDFRINRFTGPVVASLGDDLRRAKQIDLRYTNGFAVQWQDNLQHSILSGLENNG